jgi:hypothetical protein
MTTKKSQHTPEPWRLEKDRFNNWQIYGKSKNILDDLPIADNIMSYADAHLLAAAPELLDILKRFVDAPIHQPARDKTLWRFLEEIREAIAKAEGK